MANYSGCHNCGPLEPERPSQAIIWGHNRRDRRDGTTINHHPRMGVAAILTQSTGGGAEKMNCLLISKPKVSWDYELRTETVDQFGQDFVCIFIYDFCWHEIEIAFEVCCVL